MLMPFNRILGWPRNDRVAYLRRRKDDESLRRDGVKSIGVLQ